MQNERGLIEWAAKSGIFVIYDEEYVVLEGYTNEMYQNYLKNKDDIKCLAKNG